MISNGQDWRVQIFNANVSTVVGLSSGDLLALARKQKQVGHVLNTMLLYVAAQSVTGRGPAFHLGVEQEIDRDIRTLQRPVELQGPPHSVGVSITLLIASLR